MINRNNRWILVFFLFGMIACQENEYQMFSDIDRVQMSSAWEIPYNFCYENRETFTRDTVIVTVNTIGEPRPYDRRIELLQVPEYETTYKRDNKGNIIDSVRVEKPHKAVAGIHYLPLDDPETAPFLVVKANQVAAQVPVTLLRDTSLQNHEVRLRLELVETKDFKLGEVAYRARTIVFSDMLIKPGRWNVYRMGAYSLRKHRFMVDKAGIPIDDDWFASLSSDQAMWKLYKDLFNAELKKFNENPENLAQGLAPLRDENGLPVSFPK